MRRSMFLFTLIATAGPRPPEDEVQSLIDQARRGGPAGQRAFTKVYRLHVHRVYRALRPHCPTEADAEEVVQETFFRAWRALGKYHHKEGTRFVSWLLTIGINTARKRWRIWRRVAPTEDGELARLQAAVGVVGPETVTGPIDRELRRRKLLDALAVLDATDRELLSLYYGAELTAAEVGQVMGMEPANVRKRCQRVRDRLERLLTPFMRGEEGTT